MNSDLLRCWDASRHNDCRSKRLTPGTNRGLAFARPEPHNEGISINIQSVEIISTSAIAGCRPTAALHIQQNRHRTAMRWRGVLGGAVFRSVANFSIPSGTTEDVA